MRLASSRLLSSLALALGLLAAPLPAAKAAEAPAVVTSVLPVHSLTAGVMAGVGEPQLLVPAGRDPAAYQLSADDLQTLSDADLFVWVGNETRVTLDDAIGHAGGALSVLRLDATKGVSGLSADASAEGAPTVEEGGPVLWLDPENAKRWVEAIAATLIEMDADNRHAYSANAEGMLARLDALQTEIEQLVAGAGGDDGTPPRILFEDALDPFASRFKVSVDPGPGIDEPDDAEVTPPEQLGSAPSAEIRGRMADAGPVCVVTSGEDAAAQGEGQTAQVDVLGPQPKDGNADSQYFDMMRGVAKSIGTCLD